MGSYIHHQPRVSGGSNSAEQSTQQVPSSVQFQQRDNAMGVSSNFVGSGVVHTAGMRGPHGSTVESMMSAESGSTASFLDKNPYRRTDN